ncbi:hypothetical protein EV363DRAFT_75074, partial [Boletus edulis]
CAALACALPSIRLPPFNLTVDVDSQLSFFFFLSPLLFYFSSSRSCLHCPLARPSWSRRALLRSNPPLRCKTQTFTGQAVRHRRLTQRLEKLIAKTPLSPQEGPSNTLLTSIPRTRSPISLMGTRTLCNSIKISSPMVRSATEVMSILSSQPPIPCAVIQPDQAARHFVSQLETPHQRLLHRISITFPER